MMVPKNNMTKSYLKISNLTLEDEALYKCEVTYLAVNRECNNVQHITLNVTGETFLWFTILLFTSEDKRKRRRWWLFLFYAF